MHPLLWLSWRQTVNGLKRALTSPRRLIGVLFIVGYYLMIFRPFRAAGSAGRGFTTPFLNVPPIQVLDGVFFAIFGAMSLLYLLTLTGYRGGHHPADIDVLFSTPISPKHVLAFRMIRDSMMGLLLPLVMVLFTWRSTTGAWAQLSRDIDPLAASNSLRLVTVSYCLMGMGWVALGYAVSLFCNRPGLHYDRMRRMIGWTLSALIIGTGYAFYSLLVRDLEGKGIIATLNNPWLRAVLFLPDAAVRLTLGPITGNTWAALGGLLTLLGFIAVCVALAMSQAGWLFEIAAQRVSQTVQTARFARSGDTYAMTAQRARSGKTRVRQWGFLNRLVVTGPLALVWKDSVNCLRGFSFVLFLIPAVGITLNALIANAPAEDNGPGKGVIAVMIISLMSFTNTSMAASSGFVDMLNRVDMLKPLPYSPGKTMFFEVLGKALPGILTSIIIALGSLFFMSKEWDHLMSGALLGVGVATVISVCIGLATVLFPDIEDPSQRGLRGLVQLLVFVIFAVPPIGIYLSLLFAAKWPPVAAAAPSFGVGIGLAIVGANIAGHLFASFNPNE
ncbi:MAG: hypothetical protein JNK63_03020 [Chthonomonas sp.]|nr:hypothetical protein [Chthonomonas sp.]